MKKTKPIVAFIYSLFFSLLLASVAFTATASPAFALTTFAAPMVYAFWPSVELPEMRLYDQQILKIFLKDLQKNLYPANEFYKASKLDASGKINGRTVSVGQAGAIPTIHVNPSSFPLPVEDREDNVLEYLVDLFATSPIHLPDEELENLPYDKRMDVLSDHVDTLNTRIADTAAVKFAPSLATNIVRTSGTGNTGSLATGATGTRKELTYADFIEAIRIMDNMDVPSEGRKMLINSNQVAEVKRIAEFRDFDKTGIVGQLAAGSIGKIQGCDVFVRSRAALFTNAGTPVVKSVGSLAAVSDNQSILIWHPMYVRRCEGNVKNYMKENDPNYLGSILNASVRFGASLSRLDQKGAVAIVQAA